MTFSALEVVQQFANEQGLPLPVSINAADKSSRQLKALLNKAVRELAEYGWPYQKKRGTFTTIAGQDQGLLTTVFGADYKGLIQDSMWNTTRHMRIYGPLSEQIWNALQTLPNAGPEFQCWISNNHLYISPAQVAGNTLSFIYLSNLVVGGDPQISAGVRTPAAYVTQNEDTFTFPDSVMLAYLAYLWRKQKGEPGWQDDYNYAIGLVAKNIVKDSATVLNLSSSPERGVSPGIVIPPGSWNV